LVEELGRAPEPAQPSWPEVRVWPWPQPNEVLDATKIRIGNTVIDLFNSPGRPKGRPAFFVASDTLLL
jgi:hypothetical protein